MKFLTISLFFFSLFFTSFGEAAEKIPFYDLRVSVDVQNGLLRGTAIIQFCENVKKDISLAHLEILSVKLNGKEYKPEIIDNNIQVKGVGVFEITYEGRFNIEDRNSISQHAVVANHSFITEKEVLLLKEWYPSFDGLANYRLKAIFPRGFTAISEADEITIAEKEQGTEYSFEFTHPLNALTLIAGRYYEVKKNFQEIDVYGYFLSEDRDLAETYIRNAIKYLKLYNDLLYPYPYKRFSIVKTIQPASYSMPTFVVFGEDVFSLLDENLFSRQIVSQWFGNFVYINHGEGNWADGLTAYLSDHFISEEKNEGQRFRKRLLAEYVDFVNPLNEISLRDYRAGNGFSEKAIGHGKSTMLFHMLKNLIGKEAFYSGLKEFIKNNQFKNASWDDIRETFEKTADKDLSWFFDQWLNRKGIPNLEIREAKELVLKGIPTATFEIIQKDEPYTLDIVVEIKTNQNIIYETLHLEKEREYFEIPVQDSIKEIIFDREYNIMRKITDRENHPVISSLFREGKKYIVTSDNNTSIFEEFIRIFEKKGFISINENEITNEDIKSISSLIVLNLYNQVIQRLFGSIKDTGSGFFLSIKKNPLNTSNVLAVVHADSKEEVDLTAEKLVHFGDYSFIRFEKGIIVENRTDDSENGIVVDLYEPIKVIQPKSGQTLDEIIENILDKPIIYVGERHTNYEDHKVQLKIIMSLHEKGRKFAIGMEMFQKPFQKFIDDYISGVINEKEFLKETQYFSRWQFDYNLYREIVEFAKAKNIPVIALNQWSEIVRKVATEGIDSLTDIEKIVIPNNMDMSDEDYKEMLKDIFNQHANKEIRSFDTFHQSQILWDETMAHSIHDFMEKNPGYQMVVLAGVGHIMYDYGIPKRVFRLNGKEYITLIPYTGSIDENIGHFIFLPSKQQAPVTLKLGISLKKTDGLIKVEKVIPGSIAKSAGLKKGDVIVSLDDWKIEEIEDIRIFMSDKKRGEKIKIKILRKGFLSGYKEYEFAVSL